MAQAMLDLYCDSFPVVPSHLTLDLDESFDRGEQELRKFNAYYAVLCINRHQERLARYLGYEEHNPIFSGGYGLWPNRMSLPL